MFGYKEAALTGKIQLNIQNLVTKEDLRYLGGEMCDRHSLAR